MSGISKQYQYEKAQQAAMAAAIHVAAAARVISFHPERMTVDVQPISQRLTGGEYATPTQILEVPIAGTRGGGYLFRPWFKAGDVGVLVYLDHDLDSALTQGGDCRPNTERNHSDSDAVFLGGIVAGGWISPSLPEGFVVAAESGAVCLAVTDSGIRIRGDVQVEGNLTANNIG